MVHKEHCLYLGENICGYINVQNITYIQPA